MAAPRVIGGLGDIAGRYDVVLSDVWGVIHNGRESFPAACEALSRFGQDHGPVVLISNAPRRSQDVLSQLDGLGVPRSAWSHFITSGDATRELLRELSPGPAWTLGPERDLTLYADLDLTMTDGPEGAAFISCTGPYDDERETPEDYRERFIAAASRDLEMICANPDIVVQRGDKLIYCAGALAELYEALGGRVRMAGKPHAPIYELCLARAERILGRPVDRSRVLCIGDAVATDVRGANQQGLDILFIARGIHGAELVRDGQADPDALQHMLDLVGGRVAWMAPDLVW